MSRIPTDLSQFRLGIAKYIILSILTCAIFSLYWMYKQTKFINEITNEEKYSFWHWYLLSLITCGIYYFYLEYIRSKDIVEIQQKHGFIPNTNLPTLAVIIAIFATPIISNAVVQKDINDIIDGLYPSRSIG